MFFDLTALAFGVVGPDPVHLRLQQRVQGKIGSAVIFGVLALIMSGAAGSVALFVD